MEKQLISVIFETLKKNLKIKRGFITTVLREKRNEQITCLEYYMNAKGGEYFS